MQGCLIYFCHQKSFFVYWALLVVEHQSLSVSVKWASALFSFVGNQQSRLLLVALALFHPPEVETCFELVYFHVELFFGPRCVNSLTHVTFFLLGRGMSMDIYAVFPPEPPIERLGVPLPQITLKSRLTYYITSNK